MWEAHMAVKRIISTMNVVEAAEKRIKNVFSNGVPVYLSFPGARTVLYLPTSYIS